MDNGVLSGLEMNSVLVIDVICHSIARDVGCGAHSVCKDCSSVIVVANSRVSHIPLKL